MASPCGTSSLTIPAQVSYAGVASVYLEAVAGMYGFNADQSRQLAQSLLIILQDLISQAFAPGENQEVQISAQPLPIGLKITIGETGLPLSSAELASLAADPQTCPLVRLEDHLTCVREIWDEASFYKSRTSRCPGGFG